VTKVIVGTREADERRRDVLRLEISGRGVSILRSVATETEIAAFDCPETLWEYLRAMATQA